MGDTRHHWQELDLRRPPDGFCQCGCGQRTNPVLGDDKVQGLRRGQFRRFCQGHQHRLMRKQRISNWGDPRRARCMRAAEIVAKRYPASYDEVFGPAFEAAMENSHHSALFSDIIREAENGAANYHKTKFSYGRVSIESFRDKNGDCYEPEFLGRMDDEPNWDEFNDE